jgi:hypothetical protein
MKYCGAGIKKIEAAFQQSKGRHIHPYFKRFAASQRKHPARNIKLDSRCFAKIDMPVFRIVTAMHARVVRIHTTLN